MSTSISVPNYPLVCCCDEWKNLKCKRTPLVSKYRPTKLGVESFRNQEQYETQQRIIKKMTPARWELFTENERLIWYIHKRYFRLVSGEDKIYLEDILRYALIYAAATYNKKKGAAFSTWACLLMWQRGESYLRMQRTRFRYYLNHAQNLDDVLEYNEHNHKSLCYTPDIVGLVDLRDQVQKLRQAIDKLPERYRLIMLAKLEGKRLQEIGDQFGVTKEAIRMSENRALDLLAAEFGVINLTP